MQSFSSNKINLKDYCFFENALLYNGSLYKIAIEEEKNTNDITYILSYLRKKYFAVLLNKTSINEGIDVPEAKNCFILESTGNPKEFIQRRGRILRKNPGKTMANVYDLTVLPKLEDYEDIQKVHTNIITNK